MRYFLAFSSENELDFTAKSDYNKEKNETVLILKDKENQLFKDIKDGDFVYFVHSFYGADCDSVVATAEYGAELTAVVAKGNVYGCQFHPEKSGEVGLKILKAFSEMEKA